MRCRPKDDAGHYFARSASVSRQPSRSLVAASAAPHRLLVTQAVTNASAKPKGATCEDLGRTEAATAAPAPRGCVTRPETTIWKATRGQARQRCRHEGLAAPTTGGGGRSGTPAAASGGAGSDRWRCRTACCLASNHRPACRPVSWRRGGEHCRSAPAALFAAAAPRTGPPPPRRLCGAAQPAARCERPGGQRLHRHCRAGG